MMSKRTPQICSPAENENITPTYFSFATETNPSSIVPRTPIVVAKITQLLHKRFGQMPMSISIGLLGSRKLYYEVVASYGINNSHYVCMNISQSAFIEIYENGGIQVLGEILAAQLGDYILKDIKNTMLRNPEKVSRNEEIKQEKVYRKILI